jgi:hypothetical protein
MNGKELMGRVVNVDFAKENPDRMEKREVREENKEEKNEDDGENLF